MFGAIFEKYYLLEFGTRKVPSHIAKAERSDINRIDSTCASQDSLVTGEFRQVYCFHRTRATLISMEEGTSLVWRNAFLPRHLISMEEGTSLVWRKPTFEYA